MTTVEIEYCVPCNHLPRAQDLQAEILETFGLDVEGVMLKTGDNGVFTVRVDGETVFDKSEEAYDASAIVERIGSQIGQPA